VNYQPKLLKGSAAQRTLRRLAEISGRSSKFLQFESGRGMLDLPYRCMSNAKKEKALA
jgi:hypothetical protein